MTASLPELAARTARGLSARWKAVCAVVLTLGALFAASAAFSALQAAQYRSRILDDASIQRDVELLHSLEVAARGGDATAQRRIRDVQGRVSARLSMLAGRRNAATFWNEAGPALFLSGMASLFVSLLAFTFGLTDAVHGAGAWKTSVGRAVRLVPRMALLLLALLGVSLLWIPSVAIVLARVREAPLGETASMLQTMLVFCGYLVAVTVLPRLALAPAILAERGGGIRQTLLESVAVTRGHWGKVLGNLLAVFGGLLVAWWLILAVLESMVGRSSVLLAPPRALLLQAGIVIVGAFLPRLLSTLRENPVPEQEDAEEEALTS